MCVYSFQVISAIAKVESEFGRLDVCVAVAGVGKMAPFLSTKTEDFHLVHSINVLGTYLTMREVRIGACYHLLTCHAVVHTSQCAR